MGSDSARTNLRDLQAADHPEAVAFRTRAAGEKAHLVCDLDHMNDDEKKPAL